MQKNAVFNFIIFLATVVFTQTTVADSNDIIAQSQRAHLSQDPQWIQLIRYQPNKFTSGLQSELTNKSFFFSEDGKINPQNELESTLKAFFQDPTDDLNSHPQCQFRGRFVWLRKKLDWSKSNLKLINCSNFNKWSNDQNIKSISLIFATGFLGSPPSYFGHPLLKINTNYDSSDLLNTSLNYGAMTPPDENPIVYAIKGLLGGYNGNFTNLTYFYHHQNYLEIELRDLWDYELNLSTDDINLVTAHLWEMMQNQFPYYFLSDNCAYRMSQVFELVLPAELLPRHVPFAIPYTLFQRLADGKFANGQPFVKSIHRIPSRQTRFYEKYLSLNNEQQSEFKKLAKKMSLEEHAPSVEILNALIDYVSFRTAKDGDSELLAEFKRKLLTEKIYSPVQESSSEKINTSKKIPPNFAQKPVLTRLSAVQSQNWGSVLELHLRPAYYDLLSSDIGRLPNSTLGIFDFSFIASREKFWFKKLNLIEVEAMNTSLTGLPADNDLAWKFSTGAENKKIACHFCATPYLNAGLGKSFLIGQDLLLYTFINFQAADALNKSGYLSTSPEIGFLGILTDRFKTHFKYNRKIFLSDPNLNHDIFYFENRYSQSRDWDIRFSYEISDDEITKISFSSYW